MRNSGWTQDIFSHDQSDLTYGLVLKNRSRTQDAVGIEVLTEMLGPKGGVLAGDYAKVAVIPAGKVFYVGSGSLPILNPGAVTRLRVSIKVRKTQAKRLSLPGVGKARVDKTIYGAFVATTRNPYSAAINMYDASAYAVIYDRNGRLIGGGDEVGGLALDSGESLPPGRATLVSVQFPTSIPLSRIGSVRISVDPGYLPRGT